MMKSDDIAHAEKLVGMMQGYFVAQGVYVAARLGIADLLARRGALTIEALAQQTGTDPSALYRLLRALAGEGVFVESSDKTFENSPASEMLRSDAQGSVR